MLRFLTAVFCLAGCAPETPPAPLDELVEAVQIRPGVRLDRLLTDRADAAPLLAAIQPPRTRQSWAVANRYVEGQTDSIQTWVYDGLTLESYATRGGPTFVRRVTVTESSYGTSDGIAVGETREALEAILGSPTAEEGDVVTYIAGSGTVPTPVEVRYAPGDDSVPRATRITWSLYVD